MIFPDSIFFEGLEVYCMVRLVILFGTDDHLAPGNGLVNEDWFDDSQSDILVQASFDIDLPVEQNKHR